MLNMHTKHMPSLAKGKAETASGLWYVERTKGKAATICNASAAHEMKLKLKRCQGTRKRHIENRKKILRRRKRNLIPSHKISVTIITVSWPCRNPRGMSENKVLKGASFWLGPLLFPNGNYMKWPEATGAFSLSSLWEIMNHPKHSRPPA